MHRHPRLLTRAGLTAALVGAAAIAVAGFSPAAAAPPTPSKPTTSATAAPTSTPSAAATSAAASKGQSSSSDALPTPAPADTRKADPWAAKPYMGWSSYSMQVYTNQNWITADHIIAQSDAMKAKLQKAGYNYINVDSGWTDHADENGRPAPSDKLYPQGLEKVIDHVHANGQKFGLYLIPGISPEVYEKAYPIAGAPGCTTKDIVKQPLQQADYWKIGYRIDFSNPCAQKYVDSVADQLASWGVNFLKFDSVTPGSGISDLSLDARDDVAAWSKALKRHGIWFELSWALDINYADYWSAHSNGRRVEWDVECYCGTQALTTWDNINRLFPRAADWWRYAGNGSWNDFDSLDIGNGKMDGLTRDERQTAMTLWAMSAAPLSTGNDLTELDAYGVGLLTNKEVVAVDQNGTPARPVSTDTQQQTWYALNPDGTYTVAMFNLGRAESDVTTKLSDIGLTGTATARDLWNHKNLGKVTGTLTAADVPIHGSRLFTVTPQRGSTVSVNDDALHIQYSDNWKRNDGQERAATSQPLALTVTDTGKQTPPSSSGPSRTTQVNDTDPGITYTGQWGHSTGRGFGDYQDDVHYAEHAGDSFSYTFTGTGISWLTELDPSEGDADIYIDGQLVKTVSAYSDPSKPHVPQQTVFSTNDLANGKHTLRVVQKSGTFMLVDRLDVSQPALIDPSAASFDLKAPADVAVKLLQDPEELATIKQSSTTLRAGTDYTVSGDTITLKAAYLKTLPVGTASLSVGFRGDGMDDIHSTTAAGASVRYTFDGSKVDWITATGPDQGVVDVYIDGKLIKRVDTHSDARRTQQTVFSSGTLRKGKHEFLAVKETGDLMRTDLIRYTVR